MCPALSRSRCLGFHAIKHVELWTKQALSPISCFCQGILSQPKERKVITGKGWVYNWTFLGTTQMAMQAFLWQFHFRWIYLSICLLSVYRKVSDFCTFILCIATLMKVFIRSELCSRVYDILRIASHCLKVEILCPFLFIVLLFLFSPFARAMISDCIE